MLKHLQRLLLLAAMALVPWAMKAQDVADYTLTTGTDTSMWITLSSSATEVTSIEGEDDEASSVMNMGFTFTFGGNTYTQFSCNSNGRIRLGSSAVSYGYSAPFSSITEYPLLCPFTGDMNLDCSDAEVKYELTGTAPNRIFVIQYSIDGDWDCDMENFQVQLLEDSNKVRFVYGSADATSDLNSFQVGLIGTATDYLVMNPSSHAIGTSTTATYDSWPGEGRYYEFTPFIPTCPHVANLAVDSMSVDWASISWTELGTATSWVVEYDTVNFTPGASLGNLVTASATNVLLNNLDTATTYYVYVHADCGGGDTSLNEYLTFTTLASLPATLPYTCGFEGAGNNGWEFVNGTQANYWMVGNATNHGDSNSMYITNNGSSNTYTNSSTSYVYAYRTISISDSGEFAYSYDWKSQGESHYYDFTRVFIVPSGSYTYTAGTIPGSSTYSFANWSASANGWIDITEHFGSPSNLALSSTWRTVTGTFRLENPGTYDIVFAWANDGSGGSNPPTAIDNVMLVHNTCPQIQDLTASNVTTDTVTLTWSAGGSETSWLVSDGTTEVTVTDTNYTFTGLAANTPYTFYVTALCSGDDSSLASSISVRTACPTFITLPFSEDFEAYSTGSGNRPSCWTAGGYSSYPYIYSYVGSNMLYMYCYSSSSTHNKVYAMLPAVDTTTNPINTLEVTFTATATSSGSSSSYPRSVVVGVSSVAGDMTTFVPVDTIMGVPYGSKAEYTVNFSSYADSNNGSYITFVSDPSVGSGSYNYNYVAIDDIFLAPAPTCARVMDLRATSVLSDSVYLAWTDTNSTIDGWYVEYGPQGFAHGDDSSVHVYVTDTTAALGGLTPDTYYDFYVAADCGSDDSSYWQKVTIHTACTPIDSLPYFYGFEETSGSLSPCWTKGTNSTATSYPSISANASASGNSSLYFYQYAYNGEYMYAAMPLFNHQLDSLQLKFKMRKAYSYSYSYYSFSLKVGVMTDPTDISTFTEIGTYTATSSTSWDSFTVYLSNYTGTGRYIAFRDACSAGSVYYQYVYLDDVTVDYAPQCGPVTDIDIQTTPFNALISWTPSTVGVYNQAIVGIEDTAANTWIYDTVSGTTATFTGLTPEQHYNVSIVTECEDGMSQASTSAFTTATRHCGALVAGTADTTVLGTGTSQTSGVPVNSGWGNTICQSIWTAAELHTMGLDSGSVTGMDYTWTNNSSYAKEFTIILGTTSDSVYSSSSFINPATHSVMYTGDHALNTSGTVHYTFDAPFRWNGTDNLVVTTFMNQPAGSSHTYAGFYGYSTSCSGNRTHYAYQDGTAYTVSNYSSGYGYNSAYRPTVTLYTGVCASLEDCVAPAPVVTETGTTTATVSWAPGNTETSWNLYYKPASSNNYIYAGTSTTNSYMYTGLQSGTNYDFKVVAECGTDSNFAECSAATECAKISVFPYTEDFNSWGTGTGHLPNCWNREGSYSSYPYISSSYNASGSTGGSAYFYLYNNDTNYCRLTMPEVDTLVKPIDTLQLYFQFLQAYSGYTNNLEIGVMSDPNNMSTFVPVDTVSLSGLATGTWYDFEVPLRNYHDTGTYITFRANGTSSYTYSYLDDVTIEQIPTCQRPDSLVLDSVTSSSFTCHWRERGTATDWIVEYGPRGFQPGTGTMVNATSNPFTVTGVPSSYVGEFYVYSVCSSTDSSLNSRHGCNFATMQIPANIPYAYNFEDPTEFSNWQTSTNHNEVNWYRGTATAYDSTYSMYISADSGATVSTNMNLVLNTAIYRDVDFGTVDSSFDISFRYRCGGTTANRYDGLMVFLVDPNQVVEASNTNITSPWGNVNSLYRIANLRCDTAWTYFRGSFDTISGVKRVAFFWFNQATGTSGFEWGPCAVDDLQIVYSPAPRPVNMAVDTASITSTSARVYWDGPASATYRVAYREVGSTTNQYAMAYTNSLVLTGLSTLTNYYAWVQRIVGTDSSIFSDGVEFQTALCDGATYYYNYDSTMSTSSSNYSPIGYAVYNYSYTQTIIDSAQLAGLAGGITAMSFNATTTTSSTYYNHMYIYLANVSESNLSSGFIHPDSNHVFVQMTNDADLSFTTTGWQMVGFDTTFTWDGHSNVLLAVNRQNGAWSSATTFAAHSASSFKMRYIYNDGSAYDINSVSGGYTSTTVGDVMFISCGSTPTCDAPVISSITPTYHDAVMTWTGTGSSYEVNIKESSATDWPATDIAVAGTSYTFSGLNPATAYTVRVRQDCTVDSLGYSEWTIDGFVTDSLPCFAVDNVTATNMTNATADIDFNVNGNESNWDIHVWYAGFDQTFRVAAHPATVNGLTAGVTYYASVRPLCGVDLVEGDWSDTITFTTATCPDVTGLATSNVTSSSVTLNWDANAQAQSWIIEYGQHGFNQGQGTTVTSNTNSYVVNGLMDETAYDFYVKAVCGTDWNSENWTSVSATTATGTGATYTVTLNVNDASMGTVTGNGTYNAGETAILTATANAGYHFVNWSDNNTENPRSIVVNSDITLTANFAADAQGIDEVEGVSCTIYPNPTSASTTISVEGVNGMVRISVVDMNGRTVSSETLECSGDCVKTMDVENLAQGAYFVRIIGENVNMVKKLVVR